MTTNMIGDSDVFLQTLALLRKICRYDAPVLIEGETGTGKELAAREIHYNGPRRDGPFIPINCGALPDSLLENELFGHKGGAYTDARRDQKGLIAHAHKGTLFLDEVDTLSHKGQATLLRFMQDQRYRPLGGSELFEADVRVVTATNANLSELIDNRLFRRDLFYRLRVLHVRLPALRERPRDAFLLATHFVSVCDTQYGLDRHLDPKACAWFDHYTWPGNIRELENLIIREYLLADGPVIRIGAPDGLRPSMAGESKTTQVAQGLLTFREAKIEAVNRFERDYLQHALAGSCGNVTHAAKLAGKERRSFGKLLKKHDIDRLLAEDPSPDSQPSSISSPGN